MKQFLHHGVMALAITACLGLSLAPRDARAGEGQLNGSEISVLVTSASVAMVVSGPVFLSAAGVRKTVDGSKASTERKDDKPRRISAGPLPDMQVKSISNTPEGGRAVALQDPTNAENTAQLQWPQREDNPAANFVVGQTVAFTPSPQGAGWMLRAEDGAVLTFVPTAEAVDESRTSAL